MSEKHDGGPAFPTTYIPNLRITRDGMSLRDWFAGQALPYCLQEGVNFGQGGQGRADFNYVATNAYALADIMLEERMK